MQSPETPHRHNPPPNHTRTDSVVVRRRKARWLVSGMLILSLIIVVLGIYTSTRTESVSVTGYTPGIILAFGSFLGVLGLCLKENRKKLLVAAIVFLSFGIISSFLCLVVDGVFILLNIDMRPLKAGRCQYYTSGNGYIYENYYATVPCQGLTEACSMKVRSGTCYCCDLYDCANGGYLNNYYEFVGVRSCQDVMSLYIFLWILTVLNLLAFIAGILTTAVLGSIKDMQRSVSVCSDVPRWTGSSLSSLEGGNSPTAPLLMDPGSHSGHQLYPRASLYTSPAASGSSDTHHTQTLVAAIVFLSFGIISSFLCLVVDGVFILLNIDMRPLKAGRCQYYTSGNGYIYENYYATVPCQGLTEACSMKVRSGTCYCCDLYDCANGGYLNNYYEFVGVRSCQDVMSLYIFLWILTVLNLLAFIAGILTTAVLGSIKDMQRSVSVCSDVPRWTGSSLSSLEGGNSPTAPLLMDPGSHSGHQLYPRASLYTSPAASGSSDTHHTQTVNPPPFSPCYPNLLPYKTSNYST